jgi:hypothetical protein
MVDLERYRVEFKRSENLEVDSELERLEQRPLSFEQIRSTCRRYAVRARVTGDDGNVRWMEADGTWAPEQPTEPAQPAPTPTR